eukprot:4782810-Pyramimonas_sp.AAC.1
MAQPTGALSQYHSDYYHCPPSILLVLVQGAGLGETLYQLDWTAQKNRTQALWCTRAMWYTQAPRITLP